MARPQLKGSSIPISPPIVFCLGLFPGLFLHVRWPLALMQPELADLRVTLMWLLLALGSVLLMWAVLSFSAADTTVYSERSEARLVTGGPYQFSRNPMYVAFTLLYAGAAVHRNTLWPFLLLPLVIWLLWVLVIRHEERYLLDVFGDAYRRYQDRVRRWL